MDCSTVSSNIYVSFMERFGTELFGWYVTCDIAASSAICRHTPVYQMEVASHIAFLSNFLFSYNFCYTD